MANVDAERGNFEVIATVDEQSKGAGTTQNTASRAIYAVALAVSISIWFLAIRAPLWLDETSGYWWIKDGFSQIWSRQTLDPTTYYYILWLATKILGTSETALRIPTILATLGAVYVLYLAARELFDRETALIAAILFCIHPIVIFASVDVRPYAFAMLATNAAILILLRLRHSDSNWMAALFGVSAALLVYFHYLFGVVLPALLVCYFLVKSGSGRRMWRQFGVAIAAFALAFLPLIPGLRYLFHEPGSHVCMPAPTLPTLIWTIAPGLLPFLVVAAALVALVIAAVKTPAGDSRARIEGWRKGEGWKIGFCASLAFIPLLILYGVSAGTSLHIFITSHRTVAIPGLALFWAFVISRFRPTMRLVMCVALVGATAYPYFGSANANRHGDTWKYALAVTEKNASSDDAPVVICSEFPESDYVAMPVDSAKSSRYFSQLSYYKLSVPVVPMPRSLNAEAIRVGSQFLQEATQKHERFLALADEPSYESLDWLTRQASTTYSIRKLGVYDRIELLEFVPLAQGGTNQESRDSIRPPFQ